jgi:hypothetical protein
MTSKSLRLLVLVPLFLVLFITEPTGSSAQRSLPNPILFLTSAEPHQSGGKQFIRYRYDVLNKDAYPADFFAASPNLPPCGTNTKAARTWVDIYDQRGKQLNGFCALAKPADLSGIWFALEVGTVPPSYVYIELNDRLTNTKYKSNLADTVE